MAKPCRILVVDDEPDVEPLVKMRMRREVRKGRYTFVFAANGVEALEMLSEDQDIDIVLSDINMPHMDGLTLLEQIPSVNPNIRSVIVSAYGDIGNIRKAMNRGAFDFITKPIDFEDLRITIERTAKQLELWRDALETRDKLTSLNNELGIANDMQQSILPRHFPKGDSYEMHGIMEPARDVGGDFFDIVRLQHGRFGLSVGDVSDKGVPAALFMMSSRALLKGAAIGSEDPAKVLFEVNNLLCNDNDSGMFVTMIYCIFDPATGDVCFASGGHNSPVIVDRHGGSSFAECSYGVALGMFEDLNYESSRFRLRPGDSLVLYTDGITEAMDPEGELYEDQRLLDCAARSAAKGAKEICADIVASVHSFARNHPQSDDITCLVIRYAP
ncbi:MAG: SpoIIE family protein phosphatase [Rhodobacteraceae bacterium]|nr:SpoIIE family protein phosphatase [Paracoccaceae bacterium]